LSGGRGKSEEIIGKWFQARPGSRDQVVLATKVYNPMLEGDVPNEDRGISSYKVRKHVNDSLKRLQTDRIDLYQVHHFDNTVTPEEFWGTFDRIINDGKVLYMGSSNYPGWGLAKFQMHALQRKSMGFISEQSMYSLLCRAPELEVFPAAVDFGIGVIPYMPVAGGILTGKKRSVQASRTASVENEYGIYLSDTNEQLNAFSALCKEIGATETVVAIAWTLAQRAVASPIVGVRTVDHLQGLDQAAELVLDSDTLGKLDVIFDINRGRPLRTGKPAPQAYAW